MKTKKGTHLPYRPFIPVNPLSGFTPFKLRVWYYTATQINPAVGASFFFCCGLHYFCCSINVSGVKSWIVLEVLIMFFTMGKALKVGYLFVNILFCLTNFRSTGF